jgi:hypothetical protein
MSTDMDELRKVTRMMRQSAQASFRLGVEALIAEMRRYADAASDALGEISLDEAWTGIERVVRERCQEMKGPA